MMLGGCSDDDNCDEIILSFGGSNNSSITDKIGDNFDFYLDDSKITDSDTLSDILSDIDYVKLTLKYEQVFVQTGNSFEATEPGAYQVELGSTHYSATRYLLSFTQISIDVSPISFEGTRFTGPIKLTYSEKISDIFDYFTADDLDVDPDDVVLLTRPNSGLSLEIKLDSFTDPSDTNIPESNIPTTLPGLYIIKATVNETPVNGVLVINKAELAVNSDIEETYQVQSSPEVLTFDDLVFLKDAGTDKRNNDETLVLSVQFTTADGSSTEIITDPTYTLDTAGTLEILASFAGTATFKATTLQITSIIGAIPVDVNITKKYFITRAELDAERVTEIEADIIENLSLTNRITGEALDSTLTTEVKGDIVLEYEPTVTVQRCLTVYYTVTEDSVESSLYSVTEDSDFFRIDTLVDTLEGDNKTVSIKGIMVHDGSKLTLNYTDGGGQTVILTENNSGEVYKIDSTTDTSLTYVDVTDENDDVVTLTTSMLNYVEEDPQNFGTITTMPNGLYKVQVVAGSTITNRYILTSANSEHIAFSDAITVNLDIVSYLINRVSGSGAEITYLFEGAHLENSLDSVDSDFKIPISYASVKIGSDVVPETYYTGYTIVPDLDYAVSVLSDLNVAVIPYKSTPSYLDVHNTTEKLDITVTYDNVLPDMVIDEVASDMEDWFTSKSVTLNDPSSVMSSTDITETTMAEIDTNIATVISGYTTVETIVLDENSSDTSRDFWIGLINQFATLKVYLQGLINTDPGSYLTNSDLETAGFENVKTYDNEDLDLGDYHSADPDVVQALRDNLVDLSDVYDTLVENEVNMIVLKKFILINMVLVKYDLVNTLRFKYEFSTYELAAAAFTTGTVALAISGFQGTYGEVTATIEVTITNTSDDVPVGTRGGGTYHTYGDHPSTIVVAYTDNNDASATSTASYVSHDGDVVTYAISTKIHMKGSSGITLSGLSRSKETVIKSTWSGSISSTTNTTEHMEGSVSATISQHTKSD